MNAPTVTRKSVTAVANELAVSPDTVRRYAKEFAPYLSSEASPKSGSTRTFDERDIAVLKAAREQMSSGLNHESVRAKLAMMDFPEEPAQVEAEPVGETQVQPSVEFQSVTTAMLTLVDAVAQTQAQLATLPEINQRLGQITETIHAQQAMQSQISTMAEDINDLTMKNAQLSEELQTTRRQGLAWFIWFLVGTVAACSALVGVMFLMRAGLLNLPI